MNILSMLIDEAISVIISSINRYGEPYILFSGGKDSLVTLDLTLKAISPNSIRGIVYIEIPGNTHPISTKYVKWILREYYKLPSDKLMILRRNDGDFPTLLRKYGLPTPWSRWCWREFKERVLKRNLNKPWIWVVGVKYGDSPRRRRGPWAKPIVEYNKEIAIQPIYTWSSEQVWMYIKVRNLPYNPLYDVYGHSGNCMFCPLRGRSKTTATAKDPEWGPRIRSWLKYIKSRSKYALGVFRNYGLEGVDK